jgi:hypothetical protein
MTEAERFLARVEPDLNTGCWIWAGAAAAGGYGCAVYRGAVHKAHRVSWAIHNGHMPPRAIKVCHKCDTPACVNPAHLWLGTQAQNVADMVAKGRARTSPRFGSENPTAALDEDAVWAIRHMLKARWFSQIEVARSYGVSPMTISRIANNQTWPHVHAGWPFSQITTAGAEAHQ